MSGPLLRRIEGKEQMLLEEIKFEEEVLRTFGQICQLEVS